MPPDTLACLRCAAAALTAAGLVLGCAAAVPPPPVAAGVTAAAPVIAAPDTASPRDADSATGILAVALAHADRLRSLPAPELAQEIARLGDGGGAPERQMQLALALLQTRFPADGQRAQGLLQRILAQDTPQALPLHALARLLAAQHAEQRRAEEALERQAQQLRDGQRRIDQLNDRLQALRAIERSLPSRPTP